MCAIDDAERVETLQDVMRKARKEYRCGECSRAIRTGETYRYVFGKLEGDRVTYRTCQHCLIGREWLTINCGGWLYEGVMEEIEEHAAEYPKIALPLLRIAVGARRKWQRFDGAGLMPFPKLPPAIGVRN